MLSCTQDTSSYSTRRKDQEAHLFRQSSLYKSMTIRFTQCELYDLGESLKKVYETVQLTLQNALRCL